LTKIFFLLFIFVWFFRLEAISQSKEYIVIDKAASKPIPFVSIGFKKGKTLISDSIGRFSVFNYEMNDSIVLSHVGYKSRTVVLKDLIDKHIELDLDQVALPEVIITAYFHKERFGERIKNRANYFHVSGTLSEAGQTFENIRNKTRLQQILISTRGVPCIFLVNFYDVDSITKMPTTQINSTPIIVKAGKKSIVKIDAEKMQLVLPKYFFTSIVWLTYDGKPKFSDFNMQPPSIGFTRYEKETPANQGVFYHDLYNNIWKPYIRNIRLNIEFEVLY
jgi:hypothetical protein